MINFEELSDAEIDFLSDGCGKKGTILDVPDFSSTASCDRHDFDYWLGGTEEDRSRADVRFYKNMKADADSVGGWWGAFYRGIIARSYYLAVRLFSSSFFNYGEQKTLSDLHREMGEDSGA